MKKALWAALILIIPVLVFSFNLNSYSLETDQGLRTDEWWDGDYSFRRMITLTEPGVSDRVLEPVDVYIIFSPNEAVVNSIRVAYYNGSGWVEEPSQVWNETTYISGVNEYYNSCTVTFLANISRSQQKIYYVYYDPLNNNPPSYEQRIWAVARNSSAPIDEAYPWIYDVKNTLNVKADLIDIRTPYSNESASILLSDTIRPGSDWGGPVCGIITAKYNDTYALNTYDGYRASSFMLVGEFALDPFNRDAGTGSVYRVNVGPNNPAEAWIPGGGSVYILDNGPLFVRIRIITSDGGYESATYTVNNGTANIHMSITGHTDTVYPSNPGNHGSGFFNYTYNYRFYYHGANLLAELDQAIQVNIQPRDGAIPQAYVKNYGDWPHIFTFTSNTTAGAALQNMHAWYGSKYLLFNESSYARRRDFPLERWCAWYDNELGSDPSIGIITTNDTTGWEVLSLVVSGIGPNIMLQQILREGHQGDMYLMPNGSVYKYHYFVYTSEFGSNYTEIRSMAQKLNNRVLVSQLDSKLAVINPSSGRVILPATDSFQITVNFTNPVNNQGIVDASVVYYADWLPAETWTMMFETDPDSYPGLYERSVTAPSSLGDHIITIRASKLGYPTCIFNITLTIIAKTHATLSATALSLTPGESDKIYVRYERVDRGFKEPVEEAVFNITGWDYGYEVDYLGDGLYEISFTATGAAKPSSYNVNIVVGLPNYETQNFNVTVIVKAAPPPVIFDKLMVYGALAAIGAVAAYSIYNYHFKYPPIIRKLRRLRKKIVKRKLPTKVIKVRSREQILSGVLDSQRRVISSIEIEPEEVVESLPAVKQETETPSGELEVSEMDRVGVEEMASSETEKPLEEISGGELDILTRLKSIKGLSEEEMASMVKELEGLSKEEVDEVLKRLEEQYGVGGED